MRVGFKCSVYILCLCTLSTPTKKICYVGKYSGKALDHDDTFRWQNIFQLHLYK